MRALLCVLWSHFGKLCHSRHQSQTHESFLPPQHRADCTLGMNEWMKAMKWAELVCVAHPFAQNVGSHNEKKKSNNKKDFRLKCWSGKLSQLYCFHVLEQWPETVLCLYLGDSDTTWENLSASGWVTSLQKHKYKHILCCIWQLSPYQATTAVLVF